LDLLLQDDALRPRAGPSAQGGYLRIRQRKQTADWQFWFSDRFTGARNPARLPTLDAIPSNPLRPLSESILSPEPLGPNGGAFFLPACPAATR
jgi:hypothetical protein